MHLSYTFPNPRARLTGLLDVLERSRAAGAVVDADPDKTRKQPEEPGVGDEPRDDHHDDLESLSLSREGASLEPTTHDLDALSLCRIEKHPKGSGEDLDDASLSRRPQRPLM